MFLMTPLHSTMTVETLHVNSVIKSKSVVMRSNGCTVSEMLNTASRLFQSNLLNERLAISVLIAFWKGEVFIIFIIIIIIIIIHELMVRAL